MGRIMVIWSEIGDFKASILILNGEGNYKVGSALKPKATRFLIGINIIAVCQGGLFFEILTF